MCNTDKVMCNARVMAKSMCVLKWVEMLFKVMYSAKVMWIMGAMQMVAKVMPSAEVMLSSARVMRSRE